MAVFDRLDLNIRAIRDIGEGEELFISYIEQLAPSQERQEELENIYKFTCMCPACKVRKNDEKMLCDFDGKVLTMESSKILSIRSLLEDLEKARKAGNYDLIRDLTTGEISRKVLPVENVYMARVLDYSMDALIRAKKLEEALHHGSLALTAYRSYLQDVHPLTGLQMLKLGKILLFIMKNREAIEMLLEALKILQITHSHKGQVMQDLKMLIEQCQVEMRLRNAFGEKS